MDRVNSDDVYTLTQGLPGEREFIVQYHDVVIYFDDTAGETVTFQVVLREGSNEIEFRYDDVTLTNSTYSLGNSATIGISDGSGTRFEEFSFASAALSDNSRVVFSADNSASQTLSFSLAAISDASFEGSEDLSIVLSNGTEATVSGTAASVTTSITDVNLGPANTVPVTGGSAITETTTAEDTSLVFNSTNGNALAVDDPDGDSITVTLSVSNGMLTAASGSGAALTGDGTAILVLAGTQAEVNAALDGLSYSSIADFNGTDLLTFSTDDNAGQANSVTVSTVDLAVTAIDDIAMDQAPITTGNSVIINVLGNDSFEGVITNLTAIDGSRGTVIVNGDNTITYTWTDAVSSGLDNFTYTVTSGGVTETANVVVLKQTPSSPIDDVASADEDNVLNIAAGGVLSNDYGTAPVPMLDYSSIDVSGAPLGSWSAGLASHDLSWIGGITQNTSPMTSFSGLTESLVFDGSGGATGASLQTLTGNPTDADASFDIWFKYDPADYASGLGAVLYETGGTTDGMSIALSDSTGSGSGTIDHLLVQFNDSGNTIVQLIDLEDVLGSGNIPNEFISLTAVYDRDSNGTDDEVRLYVNGMLLAAQSAASLNDWAGGNGSGLGTTSNTANIGSANFGNFVGEIAKFNFSESALSDSEVKSSFDTITGLTVTSHDATSALGASVTVNADGSYSYDPTGSATLQAMQSGDSLNDSFTYEITDANGSTTTATVNLTVAGINDAPSGTDVSITINEDTTHTLTIANFGFDDPIDGTNDAFQDVIFTTVPADGDLVYDDGVAAPYNISAGQSVSAADIASGYVQFVPDSDANNSFTSGGNYTSFQFQVVDDGGVANGGVNTDQSPNTFTFSVTPVDDVVSHVLPGVQTAVEDTALSIGGVSVVDVDGDALTTLVSVPAFAGGLSVTTGGGAVITGNGSASVTLSGSAAQINAALVGLSYTPAADFNTDVAGAFDLSITSDDGGLPVFDTVSVSVTGVADIVADSVTVAEDNTLTFDAIAGTGGGGGGSADNFEDAGALVLAVTQGASGAVSINASGEIVYVPVANFNGTDTFTYTVSSGGVSETASITVTVNPVNDGPDLVADTASGDEDGGPVTGDVLANDSDLDGDGLTVTTFTIAGIGGTHSANDTVTIAGIGDLRLNGDGSFSFAPAADYNGPVPQVTYTASDGALSATSTLDITIDPVNDAPVGVADSNSTAEDVPLIVAAATGVLSNDHDGDGGALGGGVSVTGFSVGGTGYAAGATASLAEGDLTINGDGSYSFIPTANYNGPVPQATYTVEDAGGLAANATLDITVTPVNDAPVVSAPGGTVNGSEDSDLVFSVAGGTAIAISDTDVGGAAAAADPGTSSVTLSVDHGTLTAASGSGATIGGDGSDSLVVSGTIAQINAALDGLVYAGVADYYGGDLISIAVDDGSGAANATGSGSVVLNVGAVVDIVDDGVTTAEDNAVGFNVLTGVSGGAPDGASADNFESAISPAGAQLSAIGSGINGPQNGSVSFVADGSVVYTPDADFAGIDGFTYTISTADGNGGFVTETGTVTVTVTPVNDAPVQMVPDTSGGPLASTTIGEDGTLTFAAANGNGLSVGDVDGPGLTTTMSVTHGLLTVAGGSGASVTGDGTNGVSVSGTAAQINAALEGLVYTPLDDFNSDGVQSEQLVISTDDGSGAANAVTSDTVDLAITGIGDVVDDAITTNEDSAASFNVLSGLSGGAPDGASADNFEGMATVSAVTQGSHGSVSFDAAGNVTYTPDANYNVATGGLDTFTYTVETADGAGGTIVETATVTVTVVAVNDSPDAVGNAYISAEDTPIAGNLISDDTSATAGSESGVDSDVETASAALTITSFTLAGTPGPNPDLSWPAGSSATAGGFGTLTINGDGSFTLVPAANFNGAFPTVTYTADDGSGAAPGPDGPTDTAPVIFTFTPVNDDPTASGANPTTNEDTAVAGSITMGDVDLPGGPDVLTASLDGGVGSAPNNGSVVVNGDGSYTYTPDADFNGTDTFTIRVEDGQGGSTTTVITVTVTPVDDVVSHVLPGVQTAVEDTALSIGGVSVVDVDGDALTTLVSVPAFAGGLSVTTGGGAVITGNGSASVTLSGSAAQINAALVGLSYTPAADFNTDVAGAFDLSITSDDGGLPVFDTVSVSVTGVADIVADSVTVAEDNTLTFDAIAGTGGGGGGSADNFEDAGALVLAVTQGASGAVSINASGEIVYVPVANFNGTDTFTYTVSSGGVSETASITVTVNPVNDGPDLVADTASGDEDGGPVTGDVLANDSDLDGDGLTVTTFTIAGIGGTHSANDTVTIAGIGDLRLNGDGSFSFAPAADYNGPVPQVTYTASDGALSATSTLDITIDPVNDAPVGVADSNSTAEDVPLIVAAATGVLSNDHDGDGGALGGGVSVTGFSVGGTGYAAGATASLAEGDLTINGDGSYSFIPTANYNGPVPQATYTVEDAGGLAANATLDITVTPVNDAPVASDDDYIVQEDTPTGVSGNLILDNCGSGVDSDIDGDILAIVAATMDINGSGSIDPIVLGSPTSLTDAIGNPLGTLMLESNGVFNFVPAADFWGVLPPVTYTIDDGSGAANSTDAGLLSIAVAPVNDAPDGAIDVVAGNEDQVFALNPTLPVDIDDAQSVLTVVVSQIPQASQGTLSYSQDAGGTGFVLPDLVMTMSELASVNFLSAPNYNGSVDSFVYQAMDDEGETDTGSIGVVAISLNAVNDAPVANADGPVALTEDIIASGNVLLNDADIDGDAIEVVSFTVSGLAGVAPAGTAVTVPGVGDIALNVNGDFIFTPLANYNGPVPNVTYTMTDGNGQFDTAILTFDDVLPVNDGPVATVNSYVTAEETQLVGNLLLDDTGAGLDYDVDGDGLTVSDFAVSGEAGPFLVGTPINLAGIGVLSIQSNGQFIFDPATNFNGVVPQISYTVSDGNGGSATAVVDIVVTPVNDAPTVTATDALTPEDQVAAGRVVMADVDGDTPIAHLSVAASNGSVLVNPDGNWTYTPNADFNGTDQFEVLIDDLNGGIATITVNVTISPVADIADDLIVTTEDTPITFNPLTGGGTIGGSGGSGADSFEGAAIVTGISQGTYGSVTFTAAGDITYVPDPDYNGPDSFTYLVSSGGVTETATISVNVTAMNDAPTASSTPAVTLEDTPVSGAITMADVDADPLTASVGLGPVHGNVVVNSNGSWTYAPAPDFEGFERFFINVDDGNGARTSVEVGVTVVAVNDAPDAYSAILVVAGSETVPLNVNLPTDVDDVSAALQSTIVQVPDPLFGNLVYLPDGIAGSHRQVSVEMVLSNVELATLQFVALPGAVGPAGTLIYRVQDDDGASNAGSEARINIEIAHANDHVEGKPLILPQLEEEVGTQSDDLIMPIVVDAVNQISSLGSVGEISSNDGIVSDTVNQISSTNATVDVVSVDPAVLEAVQAIDALRQVHRENSGISPEEHLVSVNDWGVESLTGFSLKFAHDDRQEEDDVEYSDVGQLVVETYVRERILFIDVSNTFDPDVEGVVTGYQVEMADGSDLPDWIRIVRDGFIVAERPANLWDLNLKISAEMEDGSLVTRGVLIDGPTGEIQPLEVGGQEDGKRFEDQLRSLVKT